MNLLLVGMVPGRVELAGVGTPATGPRQRIVDSARGNGYRPSLRTRAAMTASSA
jgi:hypothetical protein